MTEPAPLSAPPRRRRRPALPPRVKLWLTALLSLALGYLISLAQDAAVRPPLVLGQDAISTPASRGARVTLERDPQSFINIQPARGEADTLLVLYPGGLVRPQAYEWLGRALAPQGVQTVIPVFPFDLAVTGAERAEGLIARFGEGKRVILAGHSLGGAMAAQYSALRPERIDGLLLMAAYPAPNVDLREASFPVLSLLAEHDGVAQAADVRGGLDRLPPGTRLSVVPGAVHSFFGRYGPQRGDGMPTVSRADAEARIVREVERFVAGVGQD